MSYNKETGMYEGYIYKIWNDVNDKIYIGQTRVSVNKRWVMHKSDTKLNKDNTIIHRAMRKYGIDRFHIDVIEKLSLPNECNLIDKLNELEIFYINKYNSTNKKYGYNIDLGGNSSVHARKQVDQYDKNSNFISTWGSITEAAEFYGIKGSSISGCCSGKIKSSGGYVWRYHDDSFDKYESKKIKSRSVKKYNLSGELLNTYNSISEAATKNNCTPTSIRDVCIGEQNTFNGFVWRYADDEFDKYDITPTKTKPFKRCVDKYDLNGNLIETYESIIGASIINKCNRVNIIRVCNGDRKTCNGFVWRYKCDPFDKYPV